MCSETCPVCERFGAVGCGVPAFKFVSRQRTCHDEGRKGPAETPLTDAASAASSGADIAKPPRSTEPAHHPRLGPANIHGNFNGHKGSVPHYFQGLLYGMTWNVVSVLDVFSLETTTFGLHEPTLG